MTAGASRREGGLPDGVMMSPPWGADPWALAASRPWLTLRRLYASWGVPVSALSPDHTTPAAVYLANAAFTLDSVAYPARMMTPGRTREGERAAARLGELGFTVVEPSCVQEGEGDFLLAPDGAILAAHGLRTHREAHAEVADIFGREVISLRLVDPRLFHLDMCLVVVGETVIWFPGAFDAASQGMVRERFPDACEVGRDEAHALHLNCFVAGGRAAVAEDAHAVQEFVAGHGYEVTPVDVSALVTGGGSIKCCTLTLRR